MFPHLLSLVGSARLLTLAGVTGLVMTGGAVAAGDPPPPPAARAAGPVAASDVALARAVLAGLDADPVLKDVNLVVSVVDRGAVIGGPVASEAILKRVEAVVRAVPGVESVKNTCFVHADPELLMRALAERLKPGSGPPAAPALPGVALGPTAPEGFLPPFPPAPPGDLLADAGARTVVAQRPPLAVGPAAGVLGAPVSPAPPGVAAKPAPAPPTAPGALTGSSARPADVQLAVAATRRADARFARLVAELKPDGGLFVTGACAKAADAWDFAAELRKLPGVTRVAVDPNLVK